MLIFLENQIGPFFFFSLFSLSNPGGKSKRLAVCELLSLLGRRAKRNKKLGSVFVNV